MKKKYIQIDPSAIFYEYFAVRDILYQEEILNGLSNGDNYFVDKMDFFKYLQIFRSYCAINELDFNNSLKEYFAFLQRTGIIIYEGRDFLENFSKYFESRIQFSKIICEVLNKTKETYLIYGLIMNGYLDLQPGSDKAKEKFIKIYDSLDVVRRIIIADVIAQYYKTPKEVLVPSENKDLIGCAYYKAHTPRFKSLYE